MTINLTDVAAFAGVDAAGELSVRFGLYLPGIRATDGFAVVVRIHRDDRFDPAVQPVDVAMQWQPASEFDLWSVTTSLMPGGPGRYGQEGTYLYRFQLWWTPPGGTRQLVTRWFTDPFARQTDIGLLAAINCSRAPPSPFAWRDAGWRTPELDDLIVYELQVEQFNDTFAGVEDRLVYLKGFGVNCLELMPVTSTKLDFDWGYGPLHYFAPHAAFGGPDGLKALIDACHAQGVAVILDVVYQHVDAAFAYHEVYADVNALPNAPRVASPMIGSDGNFGPQVDFSQPFAQQFFQLANRHWLDDYHVDGFRYDEVTDLYQGPMDTAYAMLAYQTYLYSRTVARFGCAAGQYSRLIQSAEALGKAPDVLRNTFTNAAWQDNLLNCAEAIAAGDLSAGKLTEFAHTLDPYFGGTYPAAKTVVDAAGAAVDMPVAPFQYLNSHDHSHLIAFAGTSGDGPLPGGDRSLFYRLQPLAIALCTAQGVPMLWEGEEFADNFMLAGSGAARIGLRRDMHWQFFYDDAGAALVRLYRILGRLRRSTPALRSRQSYFYYQQSLIGNTILAYHRHAPASPGIAEQYAMVLLNFGGQASSIRLPFPRAGTWTEAIDAGTRSVPKTVAIGHDGDTASVTVPSWYGYILIR